MRYTASQFKNEIDVLEIRLGTIGHLVDKIVIAEAIVDQRGRPKELIFPHHRERYAPWLDKIEYVVVDDMPGGTTHADDVARERHQRDALIRGMPELKPEDVVYVSDLDEIPYPEALEAAFANPPMRLPMDLFVYRLNWRWLDRGCRIGTLGGVVTGESLLRQGVCGAILWDSAVKGRDEISGWHLTYQGDVETLRAKVEGMMDKWEQLIPKEWSKTGIPANFMSDEWIQESIQTGRDIFGRHYRPSDWVDLDQLPPYVQQNQDRFAHMLISRPSNQDEVEKIPRCTCGGVYRTDDVLAHFEYCALAAVPGTCIHPADDRKVPRALQV